MAGDFVGLQIDGPNVCGATRSDGAPCVLPYAHEGAHQAEGETAPVEHQFTVMTDDEAIAQRVFFSYQVLKHISTEDLTRLTEGHHIHIVANGECSSEHEHDAEAD